MSADWLDLSEGAARTVHAEMRSRDDEPDGLRGYQRDVALHVLRHLATNPGIIVAERTGLGKSLIATSIVASLARAHARAGGGPFRVGLLAPSQQVLSNWVEKMLPDALQSADSKTYLWREPQAPLTWSLSGYRRAPPSDADLVMFAAHYGHGIANGYVEWSKTKVGRARRAREFLGETRPERLHVLIVDEAHQLKNDGTGRGDSLRALFGAADCPIPIERILLLTATPFQLHAAQELARMMALLAYPHATGGPELPAVTRSYKLLHLYELFDRYRVEVARWLELRMREGDDESVGASVERKARAIKDEVETLLRALMVRTHAPSPHVQTRYGKPDPNLGDRLPDVSGGLAVEDPLQRLLFLAWDGAIASRTTFVAAEQQTLTSSAEALRRRQETEISPSAAERFRKPIAPPNVQQALLDLTADIAKKIDPDHAKVLATADAVVRRARARSRAPRPTVVFVERTATLDQLRANILRAAPDLEVEIISGAHNQARRDHLLARFNGQHPQRLHVLLASKVAEMGLDVDGPANKEDIWLIHHDLPWNPAMVDQRNGRVCRPAKKAEHEAHAPVFVTYPFLRDTVDERIFKRMLMRQALAELLLGTDDVARALRLGDHESLEALSLDRLRAEDLRKMSPDLSPRREIPPEPPTASDPGTRARTEPSLARRVSTGEASTIEQVASLRLQAAALVVQTSPVDPAGRVAPRATAEEGKGGAVRPGWCAVELVEAAQKRAVGSLFDEPVVEASITRAADELGLARFDCEGIRYLQVAVGSRLQAVALLLRRQRDLVLEVLSLADTDVESSQKLRKAFVFNARPSVAGLVLAADGGTDRLFARAANLTGTLQESELKRMILDTGALADAWELQFYGGVDRW